MQIKPLPISVVPSLPAKSFTEIKSLCTALKNISSELQVDIVDGKYAPFKSWPFTEEENIHTELLRLKQFTNDFDIEMDCMVQNPEQYLNTFMDLGVKRVVIHVGSTNKYTEIITHSKRHSYQLGFALTNDTSMELLLKYIDEISYIQIMGIKEIGKQGQPFDLRTLSRVREIRALFPDLEIAVDGAVNKKTIEDLLKAGVTRFAPGSAVAKTKNPAQSYKHLLSLVS